MVVSRIMGTIKPYKYESLLNAESTGQDFHFLKRAEVFYILTINTMKLRLPCHGMQNLMHTFYALMDVTKIDS